MSEMIERVARAIWDATPNHSPAKGNGDQAWRFFVDEARAAIEAMREPTSDMLRTADGVVLTDEELESGPYELTKAEYQSMIDKALQD